MVSMQWLSAYCASTRLAQWFMGAPASSSDVMSLTDEQRAEVNREKKLYFSVDSSKSLNSLHSIATMRSR